MQIKIEVLDVDDGDAIIVTLNAGLRSLVMLVDAGKSHYSQRVISALDEALAAHNKLGPDVLLVTHYDSDHIGGVLPILEKYQDNVKELWVHTAVFATSFALRPISLEPKFLLKEGNQPFRERMEVVIESVTELNNVLSRAHELGVTIKEPYAGECKLQDWPMLRVLGPTTKYYKSLFANTKTLEEFVITEAKEWHLAEAVSGTLSSGRPCDQLPTSSKITPTNKASVILAIEVAGKRFLLTGDAGIESFMNVPNYEEELKDIFWLKAPHHGSINNISLNLVKLMNPKHVYVSGNKHVDQPVIDCFTNKGSNVRVTKTEGDLTFSSQQEKFIELLRDSTGNRQS